MLNKIINWIKQNSNKIMLKDVWTEDGWTLTQEYGLTEYAKKLEADYKAGKYENRVYPYIIHPGLDWSGKPEGHPIRSTVNGQILFAGKNKHHKARGIYVTVWDMQQEVATFDMHMVDIAVNKHNIIQAGDIIGYVGKTGLSHGVHDHFGLYKTKDGYIIDNEYGGAINPLDKKIVRWYN